MERKQVFREQSGPTSLHTGDTRSWEHPDSGPRSTSPQALGAPPLRPWEHLHLAVKEEGLRPNRASLPPFCPAWCKLRTQVPDILSWHVLDHPDGRTPRDRSGRRGRCSYLGHWLSPVGPDVTPCGWGHQRRLNSRLHLLLCLDTHRSSNAWQEGLCHGHACVCVCVGGSPTCCQYSPHKSSAAHCSHSEPSDTSLVTTLMVIGACGGWEPLTKTSTAHALLMGFGSSSNREPQGHMLVLRPGSRWQEKGQGPSRGAGHLEFY